MTPFEDEYVLKDESLPMVKTYRESKELWRTIDYDYLFSAGSLALKHEKSVNNTSLVVAIQFADSERVLLFTGDAEPSNWESWHKGLSWSILKDDKTRKVNAQYLLNNTVFYKVGHHLSQNGTALANGLNMMNNPELAGMVALDLHKIMSGWRNTMPSDYLGAELIKKTGGKLLLLGDCDGIVRNIDTDRVTISETNHKNLDKLNKSFKGKIYMDYEVKG